MDHKTRYSGWNTLTWLSGYRRLTWPYWLTHPSVLIGLHLSCSCVRHLVGSALPVDSHLRSKTWEQTFQISSLWQAPRLWRSPVVYRTPEKKSYFWDLITIVFCNLCQKLLFILGKLWWGKATELPYTQHTLGSRFPEHPFFQLGCIWAQSDQNCGSIRSISELS